MKVLIDKIQRRLSARTPRAFYGSIVGTCVANQIARLPIVGQCGYASFNFIKKRITKNSRQSGFIAQFEEYKEYIRI